MSDLYTIAEAAKYIGRSESGLRVRIWRGSIPTELRRGVMVLTAKTVEAEAKRWRDNGGYSQRVYSDTIYINASPALKERLKAAAGAQGKTMSEVAREALESHLEAIQ